MLITDFNYAPYDIKTVVHVGAHIGEEIDFYSKLKVKNVHFFEPRDEPQNALLQNCERFKESINIKLYKAALGSKTEEKIMFEGGQSSSFIEPKLHLAYYPSITFKVHKTYKVYRADEIFQSDTKIDMINLDVQGYELEVLKGFGTLLNSVKVIYSEVNTAELYSNCVLVPQLDDFLRTFNFIRVKTAMETQYNWGDAIYIKQ